MTSYDVRLVPMQRSDFPLVVRWMREPHVAAWWHGEADTLEKAEARYGPCLDGTEPTEMLVARLDGQPIGMGQHYLVDDDDEWAAALAHLDFPRPAAGIDYLIGEPGLVGRGVGTALVAALSTSALALHPSAAALVVDVAVDNQASWRALERNGFRRLWTGDVPDDAPYTGPAHVYCLPRPV